MRSTEVRVWALLGVPVVFALVTLAVLIAAFGDNLRDPGPAILLCAMSGLAFTSVGVTIQVARYEFFRSRRLEMAVSGVYVCLGLMALGFALIVWELVNACWTCL